MNDTPISFEVPKQGTVIMVGTGPWSVYMHGPHSAEIKDSAGAIANPTVIQPFGRTGNKPNQNVVFAKPAITREIVETANLKLAELQGA